MGCADRRRHGDPSRRPAMEDGNKPILSLLPLTNPNLLASHNNCWSRCGGRSGEFVVEADSSGNPVCNTGDGGDGGSQCFRISYGLLGLGVAPVDRGNNCRIRDKEARCLGGDPVCGARDGSLLV